MQGGSGETIDELTFQYLVNIFLYTYKGLGAHTMDISNHPFQPRVYVQRGYREFFAML